MSAHLPSVEASLISLGRIMHLKTCYRIVKERGDADLCHDLIPFLPTQKPQSRNRQFEGGIIRNIQVICVFVERIKVPILHIRSKYPCMHYDCTLFFIERLLADV